MDLKAGLLVTRNVRLRRPLGEGGMGTVWVAHHLALDTEVAVKFISSELSQDDPEIFARFQREAKIAARIKSQHVVQVFDHGVMEDGTPFIVMELLVGSSLAEWLALTGTLGPEETATMVGQVAGVLGKAHELGIVHRDIKPENVFLVDSEDRLFAKVLDFGIAKQTRVPKGSLKTGTGVLVGTPDYMSPEQLLRASEVDFKADLWALAVVAYRALTGRCPFEGETVPAVIVAITDGSFPPPSSVSPQGLPAALDAWFSRALARDPKSRFTTARELADSFAAAVGEARASAPPAATAAKQEQRAPSAAAKRAQAGVPGAQEARPAARAPNRAPPAARAAKPLAPPGPGPATAPSPGHGADATARALPLPKATSPAGAPTVAALSPTELELVLRPAPEPKVAAGAHRRPPTRPEPAEARSPRAPMAPAEPLERRSPPRKAQAEAQAKPVAAAEPSRPAQGGAGPESPRARPASPRSPMRGTLPVDLVEPVRLPVRKRAAQPDSQGATEAASTAAELAPVTLVVVVAAAVAFLLDTAGIEWLRGASRGFAVGLLGLAAVALAACCWQTAGAAQRHASTLLWAASAGLGALAAGAVVTAAAMQARGSSLGSLLPTVTQLAPLAGALVAGAFGLFGLAHGVAELRGLGPGRTARGAVVILLSLAALGLGYRIAVRSPMVRDLLAGSPSDGARLARVAGGGGSCAPVSPS